jgi:hypothetical protein
MATIANLEDHYTNELPRDISADELITNASRMKMSRGEGRGEKRMPSALNAGGKQ